MSLVPECLKRRYTALDELMTELSAVVSNSSNEPGHIESKTNEPGIKLMCQFWNILKEDPNCDLKKAVLDKMDSNIRPSNFGIRNYSCFMAMDDRNDYSSTGRSGSATPKSPTSANSQSKGGDVLLSKVLCNLNEAASYDKKCCQKIADLKVIQQQLTDQIQVLEKRETAGIKMLKKADCMWSCMEESYKKKVEESIERQKQHLKEQKEFEQSQSKWRKHKKDLEFEVKNLDKCRKEIKQKISQKTNDLKFIKTEIEDLKKKIDANERDTNNLSKSLSSKNRNANERQKAIDGKIRTLQEDLQKEKKDKLNKEEDGRNCIKQAREDLQKICTKLLQKRMENEDLKAEREAILSEIELLKVTSEQCRDRCKNKSEALEDELAKINDDIAKFRLKCVKCHKCVDTNDVRRFCTDCPKCIEERDCIYEEKSCVENPDNICVCMDTKRRFLDNVFENMYNVLASQVNTKSGKALAEVIFDSLKSSRNGKLSDPARFAVQDFVLATVKKNLNLTIIGGAVKTRCEMDPETYKELMLCLNTVTVEKPPTTEKGTESRKDSCKRWRVGECNCPNGPLNCVCTLKAAPRAKDLEPCPPQLEEDRVDIGEAKKCPKRKNTDCGADCGNPLKPAKEVEKIAKAYTPIPCGGETCTFSQNVRAAQCEPTRSEPTPSEPPRGPEIQTAAQKYPQKDGGSRRGGCGGETCTFTKNMRAAQCALGPSTTKRYVDKGPIARQTPREFMAGGPTTSVDGKCSESLQSYSSGQNGRWRRPLNNMIEEVMGRFAEVAPIEKVSYTVVSDVSSVYSACSKDVNYFNEPK